MKRCGRHHIMWVALALAFGGSAFAEASEAGADTSALLSASPENARVYFIAPLDGATVSKTFTVKFGLSGMGVAPAGIDFENSGHHHLLINVDEMPDMRLPIPADEHFVHFGLGQTETEITLSPGVHSLRLLLGNHLHIPHDPPVMSERITVTVE